MGASKGKKNKGGRKAVPALSINTSKTHKSNEEIEARKKIELSLISESKEIYNPPPGMSSGAKKEWNRIIGLYEQLSTQILCDLDFQILRSYCEAVATYEEASKIIKKVKTECRKNKTLFRLEMVSDELKIQNQCSKEIRALTDQLCLSPLARANLGMIGVKQGQQKEKDPTAHLFDD